MCDETKRVMLEQKINFKIKNKNKKISKQKIKINTRDTYK